MMQLTVADTAVAIDTGRIDGDIEPKLERYMSGERVVFDAPVDLSDMTAFQQRMIRAIRSIGYGETVTYTELAEHVGKPDAARPVANACGVNPVPIVIPCHRVVGQAGLGGYRYGRAVKQRLLALEGAAVVQD